MRYPVIPKSPAVLVDPMTDQETDKRMTWAELVRALFASQKVRACCDMLDAYDHRKRLLDAAEGTAPGIPEEVWSAMCAELRRPEVLSPWFAVSPDCHRMARAILEATTKNPLGAAAAE